MLLNGLAETASGEWAFPGKSGDEPPSRDDLCSFRIEARDAAAGSEGAFHGTGQEGAAGTFERDGLAGVFGVLRAAEQLAVGAWRAPTHGSAGPVARRLVLLRTFIHPAARYPSRSKAFPSTAIEAGRLQPGLRFNMDTFHDWT